MLGTLEVLLQEPLDFSQTDPETTARTVRLLTAVATYFNIMALTEFGGRVGSERQPGLVEQVVAAAFQTFAGIDPHPHPFDKGAMLLRGIIQGHPFHDANKRTGFLTASYYLEHMGYELVDPFPEDDVVTFCTRISSGDLRDVEEIARALPTWWRPTDDEEV